MNQRDVDKMFAQKPDLKFIRPQDFADNEVVGAIIAESGSAPRQRASVTDDYLVSVKQPRQLDWNLFAPARRPLDLRGFSNIGSHRDTDATQQLDPFRNRVNQLGLLLVMFVIEQMQLIKRRAGDLPVG